jgi:hypothetical protein
MIWSLKRVGRDEQTDSNFVTQRDFLDQTQYQNEGIGAYEMIFGLGFISPGNKSTTYFNLMLLLTSVSRRSS